MRKPDTPGPAVQPQQMSPKQPPRGRQASSVPLAQQAPQGEPPLPAAEAALPTPQPLPAPEPVPDARQPLQASVVRAIDVRRSLAGPGDVRADVAFQNDINSLLARFDEVKIPWVSLAGVSPTLPVSVVADTTPVPTTKPPRRSRRIEAPIPRLRVVDGGGAVGPVLDLLGLVTPAPLVVTPAPTPAPRAAGSGRPGGGARQPRRRA